MICKDDSPSEDSAKVTPERDAAPPAAQRSRPAKVVVPRTSSALIPAKTRPHPQLIPKPSSAAKGLSAASSTTGAVDETADAVDEAADAVVDDADVVVGDAAKTVDGLAAPSPVSIVPTWALSQSAPNWQERHLLLTKVSHRSKIADLSTAMEEAGLVLPARVKGVFKTKADMLAYLNNAISFAHTEVAISRGPVTFGPSNAAETQENNADGESNGSLQDIEMKSHTSRSASPSAEASKRKRKESNTAGRFSYSVLRARTNFILQIQQPGRNALLW